MSNEALRTSWKRNFAGDLVRSLNESSDDNFYLFIGKVDAWSNELVPPLATDSDYYENDTWRNGLALKRLNNQNIMMVVPRYNWTTNTIYAQYDPTVNLHVSGSLKKYYVLTDTFKVYKCISNNGGAASSSQPSHTTSNIVTTSDGYKWKFMYQLTERMRDFLTDEYMPVTYITAKTSDETINQLTTQETAIDGSIDHVEVTSTGGKIYSGSENQSQLFGLEASAPSTAVKLNPNASILSGAYNDYALYIDDGRGTEIGIIRKIVSYDGITKQAVLDKALGAKIFLPDATGRKGSSYRILPLLKVHGDGEDCEIIPTLDSNEKISGARIVKQGQGYKDARIEILTPAASGSGDSTFKLYTSPNGGHGSDAIKELQATRALLLMEANKGDKTSTWPSENEFRQFGIVKNPILNKIGLTGDTLIAGNEYNRGTELLISKPFGVTTAYNYDSLVGTYKVGNYVMGNQTHATAKILSFKDEPESEYSILDVAEVRGAFKQSNPVQDEFRYIFEKKTKDFFEGEKVTQYVTGTGGSVGATAEGFIKSYISSPRIEMVVIGVTGSFSGLSGDMVGFSSGSSASGIKRFELAGGELLKQFTRDGTGDCSFVSVDVDNKQNYGRVIDQSPPLINLSSPPSYRLTHKLSITGTSLTDTYFAEDSGVTQEHPTTGVQTSSKVAWFKSYSGTTGDLYLTDVSGGFTTGSTLDTAPATNIVVREITPPEVVLGSGEVLYIQNVRPVERIIEQQEEFKILIGF